MDIQSVHNPRIKAWAQLSERKHRDSQGKYLIEGVHLVQEALTHGADVETVLVTEHLAEAGMLRALPGAGQAEWPTVSEAVIAKLADTRTPQGVVAVVRKPQVSPERFLDAERALVVAVDGIQDPGNLGTIIRSADAAGATGVLLGRGTVDLYNPKTIRATMGSLFHLPVAEGDLADWLSRARAKGIQVVGTLLSAKTSLYDIDFRAGTWFVVGNEGQGVSPEVARHVDRHIRIPMLGAAESLNAAMAATVVLYEALRQRMFNTNNNF